MVLALGAAFVVAGCGKDNEFTRRNILVVDETNGYSDIQLQDCQYNLDHLPSDPLSDAEKNSLLFMREEEKLARDVYLRLLDSWNNQVFNNISGSEQTHMDAVLLLIEKYSLTDPVGDNGIGVFVNDSLQALYNLLLPQGQTSLTEALKVGALIEEVDIIDLQNALDNFVDNEDITLVYENLMKASRNHLRAFVRNLSNKGITYEPQRLTPEAYNAIINTGWETGHHGG